MSWDIMLINSPRKPNLNGEDPDLPAFPPQSVLIETFKRVYPESHFSDDGWGSSDAEDHSIEINLGNDDDEPQTSITVFVRGGSNPVARIVQLCKLAGWQAYDTTMGDYIDLENPSKNGFDGWQSYRDQVIRDVETPNKPWWKFW